MLWLYGSLSQHLFCALHEQTDLKGPEECKSQICVWEQRLLISRILCCRVAEITSSTWFPLDLQCTWWQQGSLALRWRAQVTLLACTVHSHEWGSTPVLGRSHTAADTADTANCSIWDHQDEPAHRRSALKSAKHGLCLNKPSCPSHQEKSGLFLMLWSGFPCWQALRKWKTISEGKVCRKAVLFPWEICLALTLLAQISLIPV